VRVVNVPVLAPKIAEGLGPVTPAPQLVGIVDGVPGLVAQVHQHLFARVHEQMIVHQPPQDRVGQVPRNVHADGAVGGPEIILAQVVRGHEGDPFRAQLADHLLHALGQRSFGAQLQIADAGRQQLLQPDFTLHAAREGAALHCSPRAEGRDRHAGRSFTMTPSGNLLKTRAKIDIQFQLLMLGWARLVDSPAEPLPGG
jgi:hypothetical protein